MVASVSITQEKEYFIVLTNTGNEYNTGFGTYFYYGSKKNNQLEQYDAAKKFAESIAKIHNVKLEDIINPEKLSPKNRST